MWCMSSNATAYAFLGSRPRLLARRSRSAPSRRREDPSNAQAAAFRKLIWDYWKGFGRHDLPWRFKRSLPAGRQAYKLLVSEVMLQQTQVERVIPYYRAFLRKFPTARLLARSDLVEVLRVWSGLGYNRRAEDLPDAATR